MGRHLGNNSRTNRWAVRYAQMTLGLRHQVALLQEKGYTASLRVSESSERLYLDISWCNRTLHWQVLLAYGPDAAPDFIFDDAGFMPLLHPACPHHQPLQQALYTWRSNQQGALANIVTSLLGAYQWHQHQRMQQQGSTRLQFELSTLTLGPHMEMLMLGEDDSSKALFGIPMSDLDLTQLKAAMAVVVPQYQGAPALKLQVAFSMSSAADAAPDLSIQVPQEVHALLPSFVMPAWTTHMCLMEYIPLVTARVQQQVDTRCATLLNWHQLLYVSLGEVFNQPLEVNLVDGSAMYSLQYDAQLVVLFVELSNKFPEEKPTLHVQAIRPPGSPEVTRTYKEYPWSPRWHPQEIASRMLTFLRDELAKLLKPTTTLRMSLAGVDLQAAMAAGVAGAKEKLYAKGNTLLDTLRSSDGA